MPRVNRRKKKQRVAERLLGYKEYFTIRHRPEGFYPEWAIEQVEAQIENYPRFVPGLVPSRKYRPGEELAIFRNRRRAFKEANAEKQREYEAYLADPQMKPVWFTGDAIDSIV